MVVVESTPQANPVAVPLPAHTLWRGRYLCLQGPTSLTLTLDLTGGGAASAVFDFGPLPENPAIPSGRYLVQGSAIQRPDGGLDVLLAPDRWIDQPTGYAMVGLTATIDPAARTLRGRIDQETCAGVELLRLQ